VRQIDAQMRQEIIAAIVEQADPINQEWVREALTRHFDALVADTQTESYIAGSLVGHLYQELIARGLIPQEGPAE
jgi:hypothetical protein